MLSVFLSSVLCEFCVLVVPKNLAVLFKFMCLKDVEEKTVTIPQNKKIRVHLLTILRKIPLFQEQKKKFF